MKNNKRIGIWGFGIVGKSAVNYLHNNGYQLGVMDKRAFTTEENEVLQQKKIEQYSEKEAELFFNSYEFLLLSPGVNIRSCYQTYKDKWLHELDLFYSLFKKPIIAITGSIGKTSTTYILSRVLEQAGFSLCVGGNIGIPTFDLIEKQDDVSLAVLEVSSFQLNYCTSFAPMIAIWTNFYPNHLDHHETEKEYFLAKCAILTQQTKEQRSLIPLNLQKLVPPAVPGHKRAYFTTIVPHHDQLKNLTHDESVYYIHNNEIMRYSNGMNTTLIAVDKLVQFSFIENILIIAATCDLLNVDPHILYSVASTITLPAHRLEKVATIQSVDFYNDSKATTTASTLAAVEKLHHRPLHLFLGGLSKGVDRTPFIAQLASSVKQIYCFGKEAHELHEACKAHDIPSMHYENLENAFESCITYIQPGDSVLLSPAGSSYDLYVNYEERGNHFKKLVYDFKKIAPLL
jgi:UDP-N-acetylmuramoylalanine--D-glutamate ligase